MPGALTSQIVTVNWRRQASAVSPPSSRRVLATPAHGFMIPFPRLPRKNSRAAGALTSQIVNRKCLFLLLYGLNSCQFSFLSCVFRE